MFKIKRVLIVIFVVGFSQGIFAQIDQSRNRNSQLQNQAAKEFKQKNFLASYKKWKELAKQYPKNSRYLYNAGNALFQLRKYKIASKYFVKAILSGGPGSVVSRILLSRTYSKMGQHKKAIVVLNKLLSMKLPDSFYNLLLDEIEKYAPKEEEYFDKGSDYLKRKIYNKAFVYFQLAWIINPSSSNYFMLGFVKLKQGDRESARSYFNGIKDNETYEDAMKLLGVDKPQDESEEEVDDLDNEDEGDDDEEQESSEVVQLSLDYSIGTNSNPNTQASSESFESDQETIANASLSIVYMNTENAIWKIAADYFIDEFSESESTKSDGRGFSLPVDYYTKNSVINFIPKYEFTFYGGEDYVNNTSYYLAQRYYLEKDLLNWSFTYTQYAAQNVDYDYLDGSGVFGTLRYTYVSDVNEYSFELQFQKEDLVDSSDTVGSKTGVGINVGAYFPYMNEKLIVEPSLTYFLHKYVADSEGFLQEDDTTTASLMLSYNVGVGLALYLNGRYIINNSNLADSDDDNNYKQTFISAGFTWDQAF